MESLLPDSLDNFNLSLTVKEKLPLTVNKNNQISDIPQLHNNSNQYDNGFNSSTDSEEIKGLCISAELINHNEVLKNKTKMFDVNPRLLKQTKSSLSKLSQLINKLPDIKIILPTIKNEYKNNEKMSRSNTDSSMDAKTDNEITDNEKESNNKLFHKTKINRLDKQIKKKKSKRKLKMNQIIKNLDNESDIKIDNKKDDMIKKDKPLTLLRKRSLKLGLINHINNNISNSDINITLPIIT